MKKTADAMLLKNLFLFNDHAHICLENRSSRRELLFSRHMCQHLWNHNPSMTSEKSEIIENGPHLWIIVGRINTGSLGINSTELPIIVSEGRSKKTAL